MHKWMCLDVGTKRIGVAISDFLHVTVSGLCCINREPETEAIKKIGAIIAENKVDTLVVGIPVNMDGTEGFQADNCKIFGKRLEEKFKDIKIAYEDERLTSDMAEENLRERSIDYRKNKGLVDIESACIILEQYISKYG